MIRLFSDSSYPGSLQTIRQQISLVVGTFSHNSNQAEQSISSSPLCLIEVFLKVEDCPALNATMKVKIYILTSTSRLYQKMSIKFVKAQML